MSSTRIRKGFSYVIGESADHENHILPINAMQYSKLHNKLITGGRDGIIKVWNKNDDTSNGKNTINTAIEPIYGDNKEDLLKLETSISSKTLPYYKFKDDYQVLDNFNLHFDWINDLQLINNDTSLVTCSSDLSLKLINLNSQCASENKIHKFSNVHTDYVKKLSYFNSYQNTIVSGGLDGKIILWDLNHLSPIRVINNEANSSISNSIYSLGNDSSNMIGCGGPNNSINLYDKRQDLPFIKKLIGHQDNVRCLLMDENYILSGSSDSTIKLWDLRTFKIMKNFDLHDDPVWCLTSGSKDFKTFYSADKAGNIIKTDMNYYKATCEEFPNNSVIQDKVGLSTLVAQCECPVINLCVETDQSDEELSLFVSTDMMLSRINVPNTKDVARYQYLRLCQDADSQLANDESGTDPNIDSDLDSDLYDLVSHFSMESKLDLQSTFSSANNNQVATDATDDSLYTSMFLDASSGGPSMDFVNADKNNNSKEHEFINNIPVEILLNPVSADQVSLIPFVKKQVGIYPLTPKSIIAKRLFNNKRWMLVLYLNGDVTIWDIFICKKIKTFKYESDKALEMTNEMIKRRIKDMDDIFQEYQTTDTLNNWCEVEIKSGKLLVTISETNFNNVEIYYDELIKSYPFLNIDLDKDVVKNSKVKITSDDRLQLSRILLNSLFHRYALFEWNFDKEIREELKNQKKGESSVAKDTLNRIKMFSRKSSNSIQPHISNKSSRNNSQVNSSNVSVDELYVGEDPVSDFINEPDVSQYEDSIKYLLQDNRSKYLDKLNLTKSKVPETILKIYSNDSDLNKNHLTNEEHILFKPLIDLNEFTQDLLMIVFENSPNLGNLRDVFSFRLSELNNINPESKENVDFINNLRTYIPKWIGQPILYDRFPVKESPKIAFQLLELDYTNLPPEKKIQGKSQRKIKRLPVLESSIKLTSHNMLRVSKILSYLTEKFESRTSEMKEKLPATEWLVLECRGQELLPSMSLQTIKSKIWKSSSDIELRFRRKFDK